MHCSQTQTQTITCTDCVKTSTITSEIHQISVLRDFTGLLEEKNIYKVVFVLHNNNFKNGFEALSFSLGLVEICDISHILLPAHSRRQ